MSNISKDKDMTQGHTWKYKYFIFEQKNGINVLYTKICCKIKSDCTESEKCKCEVQSGSFCRAKNF